jgi:hypothetical protein
MLSSMLQGFTWPEVPDRKQTSHCAQKHCRKLREKHGKLREDYKKLQGNYKKHQKDLNKLNDAWFKSRAVFKHTQVEAGSLFETLINAATSCLHIHSAVSVGFTGTSQKFLEPPSVPFRFRFPIQVDKIMLSDVRNLQEMIQTGIQVETDLVNDYSPEIVDVL